MKVIPSDKVPGRFVIVDDDGKIADDAQGYGYKSAEKAERVIWYMFKGGKEYLESVAPKPEIVKPHPGLKMFAVSCRWDYLVNGGSCVKSTINMIKVIEAHSLEEAQALYISAGQSELGDMYCISSHTMASIEIP